jgi:ATP-binding cassette subfamily A (ABC1) protein 3
MDPYSRRFTWQILQNAREGRVIVLTTHFMDEADVLGDRVAIMADGRVKCAGTPMFLKRAFGVGYVLTLVKGRASAHPDEVLALVRRHVPDAAVGTHVGAELSLRLPLASSPAFPALLSELDAALGRLGMSSYGLSVTSLEDVFMRVAEGAGAAGGGAGGGGGGGGRASPPPPPESAAVTVTNPLAVPLTGGAGSSGAGDYGSGAPAAYGSGGPASGVAAARAAARIKSGAAAAFAQHFGALLAKRARYSRRDYRAICCQLLLPVGLVCAGLAFISVTARSAPPDYAFTTANFNSGFQPNPATAGTPQPEFPNFVPVFNFKSSAGVAPGDGPSPSLAAALAAVPAANLSTDGGRLALGPAAAAALDATDPYGFITATTYPERDWQRMSSFLLRDKGAYAASKYGAFVWTRDGTVVPGQDANATLPGAPVATFSAFVNTTARHAAPVFMNLMDSALLRLASGDPAAAITARNHPLPFTQIQARFILSIQSIAVVQVALIALAFVPAAYIMFVVKERECGAKHQQLVSGVSLPAYWAANFLYDSAAHALPAALIVLSIWGFGVGSLTQVDAGKAAALTLSILLYGPSSAALCYALSHAFRSPSTAQAAIVMLNIVSFGAVLVALALTQVDSTCADVPAMSGVLRLLPMYAMGNGLTQLSFMDVLPTLAFRCDTSNGIFKPPSSYKPFDSALDMGVSGAGLVYMAVTAVAYFVVAVALDVALASPRVRRVLDRPPPGAAAPPPPVPGEDADVAAEEARVSAAAAAGGTGDVILLDRLRKVYPSGKTAVRSLSFGVPLGEVFGFLGINGAGKTSTLKMLTGDALPTAGTASLAGWDILSAQTEVRRLVGYCPQHDALLDLLSTREHLELYARIKGVPPARVRPVVDAQLDQFGLTQYAGKLAGTLSGGNKRKLSVAAALIGGAPVVML